MELELIKSPFNYIGGKFKLLSQILPLFPERINVFYDVFGGGATLSLNVKAEHIYYNDIVPYIGDVFREMQGMNKKDCIDRIKTIIEKYSLSKTNREGFEKLREDYNNGEKTWDMFYVLTCYSFNYQYRFNNNHEYNSSFGMNRSCFSDTTKKKVEKFIDRLNEIDIVFDNKDFVNIDFSDADANDLIYLDPPYLITCGNYNDGKRGFKGWTQEDDVKLMELCDRLDKQGTRFAMSNVIHNKGQSNDKLIEWSKKYNTIYLNHTYGNCNYQAKDKNKNSTVEVLIKNY